MKTKKVFMSDSDRDYLLDRLEEILHDNHCQQYRDQICEAFSKYMVIETNSISKPFDLEAAKAGKPVCTIDGKKARIICFDKQEGLPIVALVERNKNGRISEEIALFYINGRAISADTDSKDDLMMLPEKKEGWVNVYKKSIYKTKEDAFNRRDKENYLMTIKVGWEE